MRRGRRWRQTGPSVFAAGPSCAQGEDATTAVERRPMPLAYSVNALCTRPTTTDTVSHGQNASNSLSPSSPRRRGQLLYLITHTASSIVFPVSRRGRSANPWHRPQISFCSFVLLRLGGSTLQTSPVPKDSQMDSIIITKFFAEHPSVHI